MKLGNIKRSAVRNTLSAGRATKRYVGKAGTAALIVFDSLFETDFKMNMNRSGMKVYMEVKPRFFTREQLSDGQDSEV